MSLADWGAIGNTVLGVGSVFTAVVTAIVLCKQHKLQREQLNAQQLEHQPSFKLEYNEYGHLTISCEIHNIWSPATIDVRTILFITTKKISTGEQWGYYLPLLCYFSRPKLTYKTSGLLATYDENVYVMFQCFAAKVIAIGNKLQEKFGSDYEVDHRIENVVSIKYKDIYHIDRSVCFLGKDKIAQQLYDEIICIVTQISNIPINVRTFDVDKVVAEASLRKFPINEL